MTDIQEHLLTLLKEIDDICKKYDIDYYLAGGTMIGALRHGGFLPWDDDADIHMTRDNAEKFMEAMKIEKPKNRVVCKVRSDVQWRFENTESTALQRGLIGTGGPQGQFVDILILYPLPAVEKEKEKCLENFRLYVEMSSNNYMSNSRRSPDYLRRYKKVKRWEKLLGRDRILHYLERKMYFFSEEDAEEYMVGSAYAQDLNPPKELWGKPRYVKFESIKLPVPQRAEKILSRNYGSSWFEVPAYMEREKHVMVTDFTVPYEVYTSESAKYIDVEQFYRDEIRKKEYWIRLLKDRNVINPHIRKLQGICVAQEISNVIDRYEIDLKKMIEDGCEKELETIFAPYFSKLNTEPFRYYDIYIDMPDEYLYAAFYFRCLNGTDHMARKVLKHRYESVEREMSAELRHLYDLCTATDDLLVALYGDLDYDRAREIVDEWIRKEPKAVRLMRADILLDSIRFHDEDLIALTERCEDYLREYPKDGELLKYRGDLYLKKGDSSKGELCYNHALRNLKNGFCIKEIKAYFQKKGGDDGRIRQGEQHDKPTNKTL